ncbi:hypothetical protein [Blastopirellula marina]|uniref:Uncharacterized protein n=1 Tax=Blastopirellula marina TaxID=124 RepID=A0A2S8FDR0_9BACT|nr:hypothetical protein [Blastopirellula marina]PQO30064.1 hypothetical protein C5Y98_21135 [Blastopirellula marina]PQO43123.1 hypothetical protein C5Y93_25785 [Blastopirellula marina]PTL42502.1 hypothetical protein C5Y97_21145 [Blastopirellula marina]
MIEAAELGGFFAAHAIWCVSDGDLLVPILAYATPDGERQMERLQHDDMEIAVEAGMKRLEANEMAADDGVLVFDGCVTLDEKSLDAIILEHRAFLWPDSKLVVAVPYVPLESGQFKVRRPILLAYENCDDCDPDLAMRSFFHGVSEHEKGAEVWNNCLDEEA